MLNYNYFVAIYEQVAKLHEQVFQPFATDVAQIYNFLQFITNKVKKERRIK